MSHTTSLVSLLAVPLVGALIGWITNVLAIRMLFVPRHPWRIPVLGWHLWGVIPKRQKEMAENIGALVARDLLPPEDIMDQVNASGIAERLIAAAVEHAKGRVLSALPAILPGSIRSALANGMADLVRAEAEGLGTALLGQVESYVSNDLRLAQMVADKIEAFDVSRLETLALEVAHAELRHIELLGAVLGFLIGLAQVAILALAG